MWRDKFLLYVYECILYICFVTDIFVSNLGFHWWRDQWLNFRSLVSSGLLASLNDERLCSFQYKGLFRIKCLYILVCLLWQQVPWLCVCSAGIKVIGLQGCFRCIYIGVWKLYNNYEIVCNSNKVPLFHSSTCALCVSSLHIFNSIALSFLHLEFLIFLCNSCTSWSFDCKA